MEIKNFTRFLLPLHAIGALALLVSGAHAATIFSHTFNEGNGALNGTPVDTGAGNWVALTTVTANGAFTSGQGSATLSFAPSQGTEYQLDARITSVSGNANWVGLGFANGQAFTSSNQNRFIETSGTPGVVGTAWMIFRGNNTPNPNSTFLGTGQKGLAGAGLSSALAWPSMNSNGGTIDLRIVLDTTGGTGNWTATWLAKETTSGTYTTLRSDVAVPQANEANYTSVGFAFSDAALTSGTLSSFSLTQIPEPTAALLSGLGLLTLVRRRR
jgi:hypothetical protein